MDMESMRDLLEHEIQDLYSVESQILEALPTMIENATDPSLRDALEDHLDATEDQKARLEEIAESLEFDVDGEKCKGMAGILKEGSESVKDAEEGAIRDAVIIASAQKVEHYEMAGYGTARSLARLLGETEAAERLEETLDEEKEADRLLTEIAESEVNRQAAAE
ncbi:MAG: ferritin-like domain-containing protein [Gemmatimonadota bacterium]